MKADTALDYAVFQLTPTRTRCELLVSAGGVTEKLASGLLKPFLAHLRAAEEQIAQGGYSIRLDPKAAGVSNGAAPWFSKGTMERFVRFVSTPEVLERVSTVEAELMQLEEAINMQSLEPARGDDVSRNVPATPPPASKQLYGLSMDKSIGPLKQLRRDSVDGSDLVGESSKRRLLRAMDARRLMLQKEQGMAFARAAAAGFDMDHMNDLMIFAECFGAARLRDACLKFMALCKKRQEAGLWIEELDLTAAEAGFMRSEGLTGPDKHETWSDVHSESGDYKLDEVHDDGTARSQTGYYGEGKGYFVEESSHNDGHRRRGPQNESLDGNGELSSSYRPRGKPQQYVQQRHLDEGGVGYVQEGSGRYQSDDGLMGPRPSLWQQQAAPPPLKPPSSGKFAGSRLPNESGYSEHAIAGDFRDADTGRSMRPRGTWSVQSPRNMPNYAHMGEGDVYDSRLQYEGGYSSSSHTGRGMPPTNFHGNQPGMQDNYFQQDQLNEQHLPPPWQQPPGQRYSEAPGYDPRVAAQVYADSQSRSQVDHGGASAAASSDWQVATPTKAQPPSTMHKNNGDNLGPPPYESLSKDLQSPTDMSNSRRPTRRSTSPKRRSPSPMKRVQIGRNGQRRPGMVVIRNINYITSSSQDRAPAEKDRSNLKGSGDDEDGESDLETDSGEESLPRKAESVRISVQDAISMFEGKKREGGSKKKGGKKESRRGSVESAGSVTSQRSSFKRWSGASELSSDSNFLSQHGHDAGDVSAGEVQSRSDPQSVFPGDDVASMNDRAGSNTYLSKTKQPSHGEHRPQWSADQFETEVVSANVVSEKPALEDFSMHPSRDVRDNRTRELSYYDIEQFQDQVKGKPVQSDDVTMDMPVREGLDVSKPWHQSGDFTEHQGPRTGRRPVADDSFILSDRGVPTKPGYASSSRILNPADLGSSFKDEFKDDPQYTAIDDSFMVLARPSSQDQGQSNWRTAVNMESELPTNQHSSMEAAAENVSRAYESEDVFMIPDRNVSRDSLGRAWNALVDYDLELMAEGQRLDEEADGSVGGDGGSPKSEKGRFYDKYRQRRDAKLREESGPKRAERDAKLKAMQEVLERRKAEMSSRVGRTAEKSNPLAEAQARAEKLRAYKADLARSKKEKEEEEKKRLEDLRLQRRERIAARSSPTSIGTQSAASTPRASAARQPQTSTPKPNIVRKLSPTPQKAAASATTPRSAARNVASSSPRPLPKSSPNPRRSQGGSSQPGENPLSRSVPSLAELRKENTKPSGRLGTNSVQDMKSVSASKSIGHVSRPKPSAEAALLEANGIVPSSRASRVSVDEKKRVVTRKSLSGVTESRTMSYPPQEKTVLGPLKMSRDLLPEPPSVASKFSRRLQASSHDSKPFLRKGSGIGPGAGPGVRKLKDSIAEAQKLLEDETASNADTASVADDPSTPTLKMLDRDVAALMMDPSSGPGNKVEGEDAEKDDMERAGVGPGLTAIRAPAYSAAMAAPHQFQAPAHALAADGPTISEDVFEDRDNVEPLRGLTDAYAAPVAVVSSSPPPSPPALGEHYYPLRVAEPSSPYRPTIELNVHQSEAYEAPYAPVTRSPTNLSKISSQGPVFPLPIPPLSPVAVPRVIPSAPSTPIPVKKTLVETLSSSDTYVAPLAPASASPARGQVYARASDAGDFDGSAALTSASPSHVRSPHFMAAVEQYSAPIALASASPAASPASHALPQLRHTVSPNLEGVKSAVPASKKWVGSHKPSPNLHQAPKEAPKSGGFKRLLKFGRKSTGSASASTSSNSNSKSDWVSATTNSEVDDDADDANYAESRPQGKSSKSRPPVSGKTYRNSMEFSATIQEDSFSDYSTSSVRSSIPAPPANFKLREDHLSGGTMLKAPRSFFSLSSFRSKGSEGKYRA